MSVGFGFSVGDFMAAIELVGTVIDALRSSGGASTEYRKLVAQLLSLESALIQVKRIEVLASHYAEVIALRQAASQCQRSITEFWDKTGKYQTFLTGNGSSSRGRDGWMKIKWAVCKKDDLVKFKMALVGHTESILLLLATVQISKADIQDQKQEKQQQSLANRVQEGYFNCMQRLSSVAEQGKQLLDMTSRTNVKVFQIVLNLQQMITRIPGQVDRQQPVYMIDALGRTSPFHLEFVRSAEALVSILKVNFKKHNLGEAKIASGDFAIQDTVTKKDDDLDADWDVCFFPGQRVVMSIILHRRLDHGATCCPKCRTSNAADWFIGEEDDIDCLNCGLTYRRVFDYPGADILSGKSTTMAVDTMKEPKVIETIKFEPPEASLKRKRIEEEVEEEVENFRHVRLRDKTMKSHRLSPEEGGSPKIVEVVTQMVGGYDYYSIEEHVGKKRRKLNLWKCQHCRDSRKECFPVDRVWPQKCDRCLQHRPEPLECSEPMLKTRNRGRPPAKVMSEVNTDSDTSSFAESDDDNMCKSKWRQQISELRPFSDVRIES